MGKAVCSFGSIFLCTGLAFGQSSLSATPGPVHLNQEEDHQRIMNLLQIDQLRSGVDGMNPNAPNAVNYDEAKAQPDPKLPDPLIMNDGMKVRTPEQWWTQRRPQIVEMFDREIYGRMPKVLPTVRWGVKQTSHNTVNGVPVVKKQLVGHVDNSAYPAVTVDLQATLTTPANAAGPVPVIIEFAYNFGGGRPGRPPSTRPNRLANAGPSTQDLLLAKGWGYATFTPTSAQADNGAGLTEGIIGLVNKGQPRGLEDWGALRAWGWGVSRFLDYLETDPTVDAKKVGLEGHSRYGKSVLVTMADDARFAIVFVSSSGEAGAKPFGRNWGELVENIAASGEYHWMAGNFLKYAGPLHASDLPVDADELIALCAPRPVFISAGTREAGDGWVDARGMFLSTVAAGPVYRLLGKKDLGTTEYPPIETPLIDGDLAFRQHSGGHTPTPNWPTFIKFASRYFAK